MEEEQKVQSDAALHQREGERLKPRFTLLGGMDINYILSGHVIGIAAKATAGYRKNFSTEAGIAVRFGLSGGFAGTTATSSDGSGSSASDSNTGLLKVEGEFIAYWSPGRLNAGPVVWGRYYW